MKRVAVLGILGAMLLPAGSTAAPEAETSAVRPPGVTRGIAEREVLSLLQKQATWRYRTDGYLDCRFGKINRTRWACRAGWYEGRFCRFGRAQVFGYVEDEQQWFGTRLKARVC